MSFASHMNRPHKTGNSLMGRGKPVETATKTFENQSKARRYFKDMLNRYKPGERVIDDDVLDLNALLELHPNYLNKRGCGVGHFDVRLTKNGSQCFWIVRIDGSETDFSYKKCITQRLPSQKNEVSDAFRDAIQTDLYIARKRFFSEHKGPDGKVTCAVTGERIGDNEAHMDHRPPMTFEVIVTTFLVARGLSPEQVPISSDRDGQVSPEITDQQLVEDFRNYHARVASLDIVKKSENLSQSSRHRIKAGRVKL